MGFLCKGGLLWNPGNLSGSATVSWFNGLGWVHYVYVKGETSQESVWGQ